MSGGGQSPLGVSRPTAGAKTFLRHLGREIEASLPGEPGPVLERVRAAAQQLFDAESSSLPDTCCW